ncbi:MAG: ABC transporter permease [Hyphomicrobiaceae bacterium]
MRADTATASVYGDRREVFGLSPDRLFVVASRLTALVVLCVALSVFTPYFLTWSNIINVLRHAAPLFLMSAGLTLVVLTGGIDLSVGAVLGLAACIAASFITSGYPVFGIVAALAVGLSCGLVNGLLVAYARIPSFIATYGMLWIANGLAYVFMKGEVIYGLPAPFRVIGTGFVGPLPVPVLIMIGTLLVLHVLLHRTRLGRGIFAIGGNPVAARLSGMPVQRRLVFVYATSGLMASFAALVIIARTNAADVSLGEEQLLPAIAAVCLGGTSLFGGVGGVAGTAVGSLILALVLNGMNLLGVKTFWQAGVLGGIILLSVLADQLVGRRISRRTA